MSLYSIVFHGGNAFQKREHKLRKIQCPNRTMKYFVAVSFYKKDLHYNLLIKDEFVDHNGQKRNHPVTERLRRIF